MKCDGVTYDLLTDGRLANTGDWNEKIAEHLAEKDGLTLTGNHWEIIHLMRDFYKEYNLSPIRKLLLHAISDKFGDKKASNEYLDSLFPGGVLIEGTRIAGLPMPMLDAELDDNERHNRAAKPKAKKHIDPGMCNHYVEKFDYDGKIFQVTPHGHLTDASQWNEDVARHMAVKENLELTDEHWDVINYIRKFYFEFGVTPMVRLLMKYMKEHAGPEKSSEKYLYNLFPEGPARQGSRIGGLPEPQGCID
ncbi:MAG: TusE/DsrC/DsvC family sulfur relay protein [Gammaproteobacteria bacterium]|nr:TusE/DsrC/DsvC family sulfur relay protein [Gammaproteobacteria bacterium]MCW8909314.1 TusE/DsrC/DsvC family sulfur relay protein [Gammaproteobacteria bacterium]MCW9005560.1 TusE/DsrC/DsvC family sulfur relay protein [Gammaproteobacteria bacterium]MCW9056575.1 TusE/DsrC/DsvC family sulfur relay protein [Gammaproteobacteria bacterium]